MQVWQCHCIHAYPTVLHVSANRYVERKCSVRSLYFHCGAKKCTKISDFFFRCIIFLPWTFDKCKWIFIYLQLFRPGWMQFINSIQFFPPFIFRRTQIGLDQSRRHHFGWAAWLSRFQSGRHSQIHTGRGEKSENIWRIPRIRAHQWHSYIRWRWFGRGYWVRWWDQFRWWRRFGW